MTRSDLGQNQVVPVARPIDTFIRPLQQNVAAPAEPRMLANPSGIQLISQGNGGDVQGVNQFEELAQALAPFSRELVKLSGTGMELYASGQYQKGQAEAARALVLANQQMLASGANYASENRKLDQVDPVAALMMDRVNPFRAAGRENRLTRAAGQAIIPEVLQEFGNTPGLAEIKEGSPILKQLSASAVDKVLKRFGVSENSAGFIENVLPQIGQAEQKLYEKHLELRTNQMKEYAWRETATGMGQIFTNARNTGQVEWTEFDPNTGRQVQSTAQAGQNKAAWEQGVKRRLSQELQRLADETGITGEPTEMKRRAVVQLAQQARLVGDTELLRLLGQTEFGGPPDKAGRRLTVADVVGVEMFEETAKIGQLQWQERQRQIEQGLQDYESRLAGAIYTLPDGPQKGQAISDLQQEFVRQGIPLSKLMESTKSMAATVEIVAGRSYDPSGMDSLLQNMQGRVGAAWNAAEADQEFESTLQATVPPAQKGEYRRRYADIRSRQEREKDQVPRQQIDPIIEGKIKANLLRAYPNDITEAALRNTDITGFMAWRDADVAESTRRQYSAYQRFVVSRIREAEAKKGSRLNGSEVIDVATRAVQEYGTKDTDNLNYLFPGSDESPNEPSVGGRARPPRQGGATPDAARPAARAPSVFPSGQLDNMPNRANRLKNGETVLSLPSLQEEVTRVMNGRPPSAAAMRAARDAGFGGNVGRWLMQQAGGYPSFNIPAPARQRLLRSSNDAQGVADAMQTAAATASQPVSWFANGFLNAITGAAPAAAGTMPPAARPLPAARNSVAAGPGMGGLLKLIRSGEGGWNSVNRGGAGDTPGGIGNITNRSIGSLIELQKRGSVFAVGAYQFTPGVLARAMRESGLPSSAPFTPANQNRMAVMLLIGTKRKALAAYIKGESNDLNAAHWDIANEWVSLQAPNGRGVRDGDSAGNRAKVPAARVRALLQLARQEYLASRRS